MQRTRKKQKRINGGIIYTRWAKSNYKITKKYYLRKRHHLNLNTKEIFLSNKGILTWYRKYSKKRKMVGNWEEERDDDRGEKRRNRERSGNKREKIRK